MRQRLLFYPAVGLCVLMKSSLALMVRWEMMGVTLWFHVTWQSSYLIQVNKNVICMCLRVVG
jgi:hypothetical protein